jgi:hypothetical protein
MIDQQILMVLYSVVAFRSLQGEDPECKFFWFSG